MPSSRRFLALALTFGVLFGGLGLRLAWVELARHASFAEAAVLERAQEVSLRPSRGAILDRDGVPLEDPVPLYRVVVYPAAFDEAGAGQGRLGRALGLTAKDLAGKLGGSLGPVEVAAGLSIERAAEVTHLGLEGVAVVSDETRRGPAALASHVVGYVAGETGDGLEGVWNAVLAGDGPEYLALFVDGRGEPVDKLGWRKLMWPGSGSPWTSLPCDLVTTIDSGIQRAVETVMDDRVEKGAVVVLDPRSGDVLALASRPDFDPDRVADYLARTDGCLIDRALAPYPPGSVWKPVLAAAAIEAGAVKPDEVFDCSGAITIGGTELSCYSRAAGGHGRLGLSSALALSCNVVFAEVGERLGSEALAAWAARFGFGRVTGVGLPGECSGVVPGGSAAATVGGPAAAPAVSIGQGGLEVTPLQVACAYATLAHGGILVTPRLVRAVKCPNGASGTVVKATPAGRGAGRLADASGLGDAAPRAGGRVVSRFTAAAVTAALVAVVDGGTGRPAGVRPDVAGKTGTAETGRVDSRGRELYDAWFAGFWPAHAPRYVVVVLIEDTPEGGQAAARVFGEIAGLVDR